MKLDIVFITDIEHSAPRISNFITNLKEDEELNIILIGANYTKILNANDLPEDFSQNITQFLFNRKLDIVAKFRNFYRNKYLYRNIPNDNKINLDNKSSIFFKLKNYSVKLFLSIFIPDQYIFELFQYFKQFKNYLNTNENKIIIISSSPYSTCHIAASIIKRKYKNKKILWIADYRDLWSLNHNYPFSNIRKKIDKKLELYFLRNSDYLTTVSLHLSNQISAFLNKKTYIIPNGFSIYNKEKNKKSFIERKPNTRYFLHVGSIYFEKQDVVLLFDSISKNTLDKENDPFELHFSGNFSEKLEMLIRKYNLQNVVKQIGFFNRNDSNQMQLQYDYLFYFDWIDNEGVLPLKFYEYINSNRPIISIGNSPNSSTGLILKKLNRGVYLSTNEEIYEFFIDSKKCSELTKNLSFNENHNYEYSFKNQSNKFSYLIKEISKFN